MGVVIYVLICKSARTPSPPHHVLKNDERHVMMSPCGKTIALLCVIIFIMPWVNSNTKYYYNTITVNIRIVISFFIFVQLYNPDLSPVRDTLIAGSLSHKS